MRLYANPYDMSATGFFFETIEEYEEQYKAHAPVEEYEIDFIGGEDWEQQIFEAASVNQANLSKFFDLIEDLDGMSEQAKVGCWFRLHHNGDTLDGVCGEPEWHFEDCVRHACDGLESEEKALEEYAYEIVDGSGAINDVPEWLRNYIDYAALGRDMRLNGEVSVDDFDGITYVFDTQA
jgi:hypothetical protein